MKRFVVYLLLVQLLSCYGRRKMRNVIAMSFDDAVL